MFITRVGVGTAPMGSNPNWRIFWGPQDETDAIRAIRTAIGLGINWIDTAPFYGWGRAEEIVGRAIRGRRDQVYLFTKCGTRRTSDGGWFENLQPVSIRRELEQSLTNLQTDRIDLLQFHDPDPETPIEESWSALQDLISEGKVRHGGLSNHPIQLIERAMAVGPVTAIQHPYSLFQHGIEQEVLPFAEQHGLGVLSWGTLAHGFLADGFDTNKLHSHDFRREHAYAQDHFVPTLQAVRKAMAEIAEKRAKAMVDVAIAWALKQPTLTGVIVGIRDAQEASRMLGGTDWALSDEELAVIERTLAEIKDCSEGNRTTDGRLDRRRSPDSP
jgi:aryl-alcohol dehydrogenase-like predicted oxidoreductase